MRSGRVFRRCGRCNSTIPEGQRFCVREDCGWKQSSWGYTVDVAPAGQPRKQRAKAGFRTRELAVKAMGVLQVEIEEGSHVAPSKQTTGQYLAAWLEGKSRLRASTRTSYASAVRRLVPLIGSTPLQALTRQDVKSAYAAIAAVPTRNGTEPAVKTVHLVHLALHAALRDAMDDGLVARNVADGAHAAPKPGEQKRMGVWTAGQIGDFLAGVEQDDLHPLFWVAAYTGMRRGEVLALRWVDLNTEEGFVSVRQQISRKDTGAGQVWAVGPPKTDAGRRRVDLDPETLGLLQGHKARQAAASLQLGEAYDRESDLIFARADGRFFDPDSVTGIFGKLVRRSGLPRIRLHDLRHSHASLLIEQGAPIHMVSQRLGHESPDVTLKIYAHVMPGGQAGAAAKFAAVISGRG